MLKGLSRNESKRSTKLWLEKFGMMDWRHRKIEELSKGMQQKIQFIATILHDPKLIILDEPFSGLDPVNTNLIKDEILSMRADGKSIIFSTHRMEQVEEVCEEIALISEGHNVLNGRVEDIKQNYKSNLFRVETAGLESMGELLGLDVVSQEGRSLTFRLIGEGSSNDALKILLTSGITIIRFEEILPSLNEVFIKAVTK
jgi:ABC-2 type transport system ATP-binding protein